MEKLSKLTISNSISLNEINFNGFSSSPGWSGFFESKDLSDVINIKRASELVYSFFKSDWDSFFLLSALAYDDTKDLDSLLEQSSFKEYYLCLYEQAKKTKFINEYSGYYADYIDSFLCDDIYPSSKVLNMHFDSELLLPYCELFMAFYFGKIKGQICFLINPKLGIALYPHDDIGYGCISLNGDKSVLHKFLNFCKESDYFNVVIE